MILFNLRLKELRAEKQITQKDLAKIVGVKQVTLSAWEVGTKRPSYEVIESLCKYFECTSDYLLGLTEY